MAHREREPKMTIKTTLTARDYRAFKRHVLFRYRKIHWIFAVPLLLIIGISWFGGKPDESVGHRVAVLLGALIAWIAVCIVMFAMLALVRRLTGARFRPQLGEHIFEVSEAGVVEENTFARTETKRAGIKRVDDTTQYFFVITTSGSGHIIPKRDVTQPAELLTLKALLEGKNG